MGTLDSNGIYIYDETDAPSPLHVLLNSGQSATSDALETSKMDLLNDYAVFKKVSGVAQRNQYLADMTAAGHPGTPTNPVYVMRTDTRMVESYNGATWRIDYSPDDGVRYVTGMSEVTTNFAALPGPIVNGNKRRDTNTIQLGMTFVSNPTIVVSPAIYTSGHVIIGTAIELNKSSFAIRLSIPQGTPTETRWFAWAAYGKVQ